MRGWRSTISRFWTRITQNHHGASARKRMHMDKVFLAKLDELAELQASLRGSALLSEELQERRAAFLAKVACD